jgi:hypothetical protein
MSDYGEESSNLDYTFVDSIRNDGLESHFDHDDIMEFMGQ